MDPGRCPECGVECPDVSPRARLPVWAVVCAVLIGVAPAGLAEVMLRVQRAVGGVMMRVKSVPDSRDAAAADGYLTMAVFAVLSVGVVVGLWVLLTRRERVRRVGARGRRMLLWIMAPLAVLVGFAGLMWVGLNLIPW